MDEDVLSAPLEVSFEYTRSLGPTLSRFMTALREGRILGVRGSDGRVHAPPPEFDPYTGERLPRSDNGADGDGFVEVADVGEVVTWSWMPEPLEGQPLGHGFAWALIRLDGAHTSMLHAVDAGNPANIAAGTRVRARWRPDRVGHIRDIECFDVEGIRA